MVISVGYRVPSAQVTCSGAGRRACWSGSRRRALVVDDIPPQAAGQRGSDRRTSAAARLLHWIVAVPAVLFAAAAGRRGIGRSSARRASDRAIRRIGTVGALVAMPGPPGAGRRLSVLDEVVDVAGSRARRRKSSTLPKPLCLSTPSTHRRPAVPWPRHQDAERLPSVAPRRTRSDAAAAFGLGDVVDAVEVGCLTVAHVLHLLRSRAPSPRRAGSAARRASAPGRTCATASRPRSPARGPLASVLPSEIWPCWPSRQASRSSSASSAASESAWVPKVA